MNQHITPHSTAPTPSDRSAQPANHATSAATWDAPAHPLTWDQARLQATAIVAELEDRYQRSVDAAEAIINDTTLSCGEAGTRWQQVTYPQLTVTITRWRPIDRTAPYGYVDAPGRYTAILSRPQLLAPYFINQLTHLLHNYPAAVTVTNSQQRIPVEYLPLPLHSTMVDRITTWRAEQTATGEAAIAHPSLDDVDDGIIDGSWEAFHHGDKPLFHFSPARVDIALQRIMHYTGNPVEDLQHYLLFTNYAMHTEQFVHLALDRLADPTTRYTGLRLPNGELLTREQVLTRFPADAPADETIAAVTAAAATNRQMPRVDLIANDSTGVSLINIGVGPSNAKTITDCVAVLRPECWIMIGHCAGLDGRMRIGDLILGNAYQRHDHILHHHLSGDIPIPAIPEIQRTLEKAVQQVFGSSQSLLRTGTVLSTDDRNWEWHTPEKLWKLLTASTAVAVDMESATLAANGYRYRVPYGTLLSVSDLPLHNVPKLPAQAQNFYASSKRDHVACALLTVEKLASKPGKLHTRKLRRTIAEVPFR
ncbi:AMP nucleosidase [Corynebacterium choanae]|uniref:AMP nucleosidase n=1 Tax=Corynebacterium choanae TaxID=1862358 RepID=A0A3G6J360_9CORY|nr:AMP nucleosidase [Corynebacterium choanae]AZA12447.1 AMP nucleosidase [Corynebacterium choanae]